MAISLPSSGPVDTDTDKLTSVIFVCISTCIIACHINGLGMAKM